MNKETYNNLWTKNKRCEVRLQNHNAVIQKLKNEHRAKFVLIAHELRKEKTLDSIRKIMSISMVTLRGLLDK